MAELKVDNEELLEDIENEMIDGGMTEDELIKGLISAANFQEDSSLWKQIDIVRNKKQLFSFRIRPINDEELERAREAGKKYKRYKNRQYVDSVDENKSKINIIYTATVEEDKKKVWGNPKVKRALDVLGDLDVVDLTLLPGEKDAIIDQIDKISGFYADFSEESKVEIVKN